MRGEEEISIVAEIIGEGFPESVRFYLSLKGQYKFTRKSVCEGEEVERRKSQAKRIHEPGVETQSSCVGSVQFFLLFISRAPWQVT